MIQELKLVEQNFGILDHIPVGVSLFREDGTVLFWNRTLAQWTNLTKDKILGQKIQEHFPHLLQPKYANRFKAIFAGGSPIIFSAQLDEYIIPSRLINGQLRIQQATITSVPSLLDQSFYALLVIEDVTDLTNRLQDYRTMRDQALNEIKERKQAEQDLYQKTTELEQRNFELTKLSEMNDLLQACLSIEEAYQVISKSAAKLFPQVSGSLFILNQAKQSLESVAIWGDTEISESVFPTNQCWALRRGKLHSFYQEKPTLICQHIHFSPNCQEYLCMPMNAQGEALGLLHLASPIAGQLTEAKKLLALNFSEQISLAIANIKLRDMLQQQSIRDPLTGLFNRRYMEEALAQEIYRAQRHKQLLGLIMLDLDQFKNFNDVYGNEAGDSFLQELGQFLYNNVRNSDIACRYRAEEILLILPQASVEDTQKRAEQIREGIKLIKIKYQHQILPTITVSLGVACFPQHGKTLEELIHAVNLAMEQAQNQGGDMVVISKE